MREAVQLFCAGRVAGAILISPSRVDASARSLLIDTRVVVCAQSAERSNRTGISNVRNAQSL